MGVLIVHNSSNRGWRALFWWVLVAGLLLDWWQSPPINLRLEPPLLAIGSGQASTSGHCSTPPPAQASGR